LFYLSTFREFARFIHPQHDSNDRVFKLQFTTSASQAFSASGGVNQSTSTLSMGQAMLTLKATNDQSTFEN
jgi:hypothetical protein